MKQLAVILLGAAALAQPPAPPARITIKSGTTEQKARKIEFSNSTMDCTGSDCVVTITAAAGNVAWGAITGTLSNQTDLQTALNGKANATHTHAPSDLTQAGATTGQALVWNGSQWAPGTVSGSGTANYSQSFTSQTSVTLTHNAGTTNVLVACYDSSNVEIIPQSVTIASANSVTVTFGSATTGRCVVNSSGGGGGGSGTVYTGTGLTGDGSQANPVRVDPSGAVASQAAYSASLNFSSISGGSCAELSITATGVAAGQTIAPGWPTLPSGLIGMMYAGTDVIVVRLCNVTGSAIDPAALTFTGRVIGGF
jgi:hypothetical protein